MVSVNKKDDSTFTIGNEFNPTISFNTIGSEYTFRIDNIEDLVELTDFSHIVTEETDRKYLHVFWRLGYDKCKWSEWYDMPIKRESEEDGFRIGGQFPFYEVSRFQDEESNVFTEFPELDPSIDYMLEIKWIRVGTDFNEILTLSEFEVNGTWDRPILTDAIVNLTIDNVRDPIYIRPQDIYKVFSITDFEIISSDNTGFDIDYRVSQDSFRTWTEFEPLTKENIKTTLKRHRLSPIRFFWIEYKITMKSTSTSVSISDINLIGDIQNISEDYTKTNFLGLRECCGGGNTTRKGDLEGNGIIGFNKTDDSTQSNGQTDEQCLPPELANGMTEETKNNLWNPYEISKPTQLYNSLANSTTEMFGWKVEYFLTDPDKFGIDKTIHEYSLKNIVSYNDIKVMVDQNQFPDNQISFNQFDMFLFDSFEIHITKDQFKKAFGLDQRPSKEDFLWFCEMNRMYKVSHAQSYKDFLNSSVYYKVILTKYNDKASVKASNSSIEQRIAELTANTTLEETLGIEKEHDKKEVAYKEQHSTLSKDVTRDELKAPVEVEYIQNASTLVSKYHYNLSNIIESEIAVSYKNSDSNLKKSDNRAYSCWFKLPLYDSSNVYSLIDNYDSSKNIGYKVELSNNIFTFTINSDTYTFVNNNIKSDNWYCYVININQRQGKLEQYLYERNLNGKVATSITSNKLLLVNSIEVPYTNSEFTLDSTNQVKIYGSDIRMTNIRLYSDLIPIDTHDKVLNQNIVRDTDYTIIVDNTRKRITNLDNLPYN